LALRFFPPASLLEFPRQMKQRRGRGNVETRLGVHAAPSDTQMREMVDAVPGEWLRPLRPALFAKGRRAGWATAWKRTVPRGAPHGAYAPVMREGRADLHAPRLACPGWVPRSAATGDVHGRHPGVSATLVNAGAHRVLPLEVEAGRPSEGQDQPAWEGKAAQRLSPRRRQAPPQLPWMIGGAALSGHQPGIAPWRELRRPPGVVGKPTAHVELCAGVADLERWDACDPGQGHDGPAGRRRVFA